MYFAELKKTLIRRLRQKGIDQCLIPGFLRLLANSCFVLHYMKLSGANERLRYLGWDDFELDEYTLQLALACFEAENLNSLQNKPPRWFENHFQLHNCHTPA